MAPFSERLTLAIVGPLVTVILGTLIIGGLIQLITNRAQNRRAKEDQKLEQRRSDNALRHELLSDMTEAASALYLAAQRYSRAKRDRSAQAQQELSDARKALYEQYHKSRTLGEILESRLSAYFEVSEPQETWHKVMDLLTVRYFRVIDRATPQIYEVNEKGFEGKEHSGLTVDQLKVDKTILDSYRAALKQATEVVLTEPLRPRVG
jgi:hypothetical protein